MLAGARDFLMKPFSGDELMAAIRRVYETRPAITAAAPVAASSGTPTVTAVEDQATGHVITVYSPKGGSGCTTVAINVAVSLAQRGYKTLLVDTSLQFGDVAVTLNMRPITSIVDLIDRIGELDADLVSSVAIEHERTGLSVLLAPAKPEMAELVKADNLEAILNQLATQFDYVIVDTASGLNEITLTALDIADRILLVTQQNLTTLTNVRRFYDVIDQLNYPSNKILLVANNVSERLGISVKDISDALKRPIVASIESDLVTVTTAADRGTPLVLSQKRRSSVASAFSKLVDGLEAEFNPHAAAVSESEAKPQKKSLFERMFSR